MKFRLQMALCAVLGGLIGSIFSLICFPINLLAGGIAVALYVRSRPEIYISDSQALGMGTLAGFFSAIFSTFVFWYGYHKALSIYAFFVGDQASARLEMKLESLSEGLLSLFVINMGLSVLFGVLGGWICLRWVYQQHRIPSDV